MSDPRCVLVVDDDESIREVCRVVLATEGYRVVEAVDVPECLVRARADEPDLILLDWMMPGQEGIEALQALKLDPLTREVPVVMLTALDSLANITVATYNGADGYLSKPFEVADLLTVASRYTERDPGSARGQD